MALTTQTSVDGNVITISITGRFDFNLHEAFRRAYEQDGQPGTQYIVDLSRTEYLDSSALGMLLLLHEHAGGDDANIRIVHGNEAVQQILTTAKFDQLFTIA